MFLPFYKKKSFESFNKLSSLDSISRKPFLNGKDKPSLNIFMPISKITIHLAWLKNFSRSFSEADEMVLYLISGKWGKPTKRSGAKNWLGESVSSYTGLQVELSQNDVMFAFIEKLGILLFDHKGSFFRDSRFHVRWDGMGNVC